MRLLIVIVNYKSARLTEDCLLSLAPEVEALGEHAVHVHLVENASQDGSAEQLVEAIQRHAMSEWVTLIPVEHNGGFAAGNNAGIAPARRWPEARQPEYVLLLNPDTLVQPGGLRELLAVMDERPNVGIAGSRLENRDTSPRRSAFRFPSVWSELDRGLRFGPVSRLLIDKQVAPEVAENEHETDWVAGASMIVRSNVFDDVGLMDNGYFLYYEETDFCLQAREAGWRCWYAPRSRVTHLVGQSTGVTGSERSAKPLPKYWFESRRRYFVKNYGRGYALLADLAWITGTSLAYLRGKLQPRVSADDPPRMRRDFCRYSLVPSLMLRSQP